MGDMTAVIVPKTDQLNSDSLMSGPITIRVRNVAVSPGTEQPVSVFYEGDDGKPWRPCKSMARILVAAWGADSSKYAGKSLTLYRDPKVKWGGMEVGGIRVSHMTDIAAPMTVALTETKQSRKPFTVKPLQVAQEPRQQPAREASGQTTGSSAPPAGAPLSDRVNTFLLALAKASTKEEADALWIKAVRLREDAAGDDGLTQQLNDGLAAALAPFNEAAF